MYTNSNSADLFSEARKHIPGGVNSPVRSFKHVGCEPVYIDKANGAYVYDVDGNKYIDYVNCWGAILLGHSHPNVIKAVTEQSQKSLGHGACSSLEIEIAKLIKNLVPSIDKVRLVNSGTEATMTAIRLARGFTSRDKILKFSGCYHGHHDSLLVKAGSGVMTLNLPDSPGVPNELTKHTFVAPYNDIETTIRIFEKFGNDIACIIIEPIVGNMNMIMPKPDFLQSLKKLCEKHGTILIFDEVMTGFRVAKGGAQQIYGIKPDLTCLGKIIGGGLPVGAIGGRQDIMDNLAPIGQVYQAGTLSGNPIALAAGIAALEYISETKDLYKNTNKLLQFMGSGIEDIAKKAGMPVRFVSEGAMFGFTFDNDPDNKYFAKIFNELLKRGVYIAPSPYEAGFISASHTLEDINFTINGFNDAFTEVKKHGELNVHRVKTDKEPINT